MAQYGTAHGHAAGKMKAMRDHDGVDVVGIYEPDGARQTQARSDEAYEGLHWFGSEQELLSDQTIGAVAAEGDNSESLKQVERLIDAGKHVWYDKPAGYDWSRCQRVFANARQAGLQIQMGYMFRYHPGFCQVADWARSGMLGQPYSVRAHMSTMVDSAVRERTSPFAGGILYDLAGHVLDEIVWMLGRPHTVTPFLRNDTGEVPAFMDNTLAVFEFDSAMAIIDIAAMEARPVTRRFEVYGTKGSAIILEPFEPGDRIRLCLDEARGGYVQGEQVVEVAMTTRQELYEFELAAFVDTIDGKREPDRSLDHELLVQESLLRAAGELIRK